MSKNTPTTSKASESKNHSPLDPIAEFQQLRLENSEIYRKMMTGPPLFNPNGNSSNEMLGKLLNELKEMRREITEIKEDVNVMKLEQEYQKEVLEEMGENQHIMLGGIKLEQDSQKEALSRITQNLKNVEKNQKQLQEGVLNVQNNVTGIKKHLEKVEREQQLNQQRGDVDSSLKEPISQRDIRRQIYGKWRDVDDNDLYFSAKFECDTFMQKWNEWDSYNKYKIGVENPENEFTASIEDDKIVLRILTDQGEEDRRFEYYIANKRLKYVCYNNGKEFEKDTYERIGDPDPE